MKLFSNCKDKNRDEFWIKYKEYIKSLPNEIRKVVQTKIYRLNKYDFRKKLYYAKVWYYTETNDLTLLENHELRGYRNHHLDHILPISHGYKNNIDPTIIGGLNNLRFIPWKENIKKGDKII
jgi:5-methylcytosine-specific restriction endonuclease McrA